MKRFQDSSSDSESDTSSNVSSLRLIDDPDNYAKEFPVRNSRNPKPQYKISTVHEPVPKGNRSRPKAILGRRKSQTRKLTPRRKNVISRFLKECSKTPGKYGRIGSLDWYCELTNKINTPTSNRNLGEPVSNSDVQNWLDHADFADTYEKLKAGKKQQPVPGSSKEGTKDNARSASLPLKKRLRQTPQSYLEVASRSVELGNSMESLACTPRNTPENRISGDEEPAPCVSTTSSLAMGRCLDQEPISPTSDSSSTTETLPGKSAVCVGPVTVIQRNLSADELRAQAAAFAEQLVVPSIANVKQEEDVYEQPETEGSPEVRINQRSQEPGISSTESQAEGQNVRKNHDNANPDQQKQTLIPYESLGFRIQQEVLANQGPDSVRGEPGDTEMSEEEETQAITQVLTSLHSAIHTVRQEFVHLTNLRYHRRAPVAMSVLGFVVDSLISFVANYLNPESPVEY